MTDRPDTTRGSAEGAEQLLPDDASVLVVNVARSTITPYGTIGGLGAGYAGSPTLSAEADMRAQELAADRPAWDVSPLPLDGIDYALFTRTAPEGAVAHADLGWAVVALWSTGPLPRGPFHLLDVPDEPVPR